MTVIGIVKAMMAVAMVVVNVMVGVVLMKAKMGERR
jgi:hypothetical protein